jgi:D-alanyl-lipoteichoic acid acyltransferase DltB (MBOAT superfamily)
LYFFLAYLFNSTSFLALLIFDIPTRDNFYFPFLATSLSDFWGRRWNTMTAKVLRTLSYDLVVDGEWIHQEAQQASRSKVTELRRAAGIFAVFTLSGIIHEVFLWSLGGSVDCEWFAYFFLQAPLLLIEKQIQNFFSKYCGIKSIPKPISILLFFSLNFFMGMMFFVPQARRSGGDELALLVRSTVLGY